MKEVINAYFNAYKDGNSQKMMKLYAKDPKSRVLLSADCSTCGTQLLITSKKQLKNALKNVTQGYNSINFKIRGAKAYGELGWIWTEQAGCSSFPYTPGEPMHLNA